MHTFETPGPTSLSVELGAGDVTVTAEDTGTTSVELVAHDAGGEDLVARSTVEQRGDGVVVRIPKGHRGVFSGGASVGVTVTVPTGSAVRAATDSADVRLRGTLGTTSVRTGSGEVDVEVADATEVATGSGDVHVDRCTDALRVVTGSGDVDVDDTESDAVLKTGSGDLRVGRAAGSVEMKSGSGDLLVEDADGPVRMKTGSGDLTVARAGAVQLDLTTASGGVRVGIRDDLPAWLDLSAVTGRIRSDLDDAPPATDGEPYTEVHARSVSGDVRIARV